MNGYEFRKRKPIRGFRYRANKTITPLKCTLYVQMKPLWKLMRVMGLLPYVEVPETGNIAFHWQSSAMLYSMIYFTIIFIVLILYLKQRLEEQFSQEKLEYLVHNFLNLITTAPSLFTPLTFWPATKGFVNHVRSWAEFETNYYQFSRTALAINIKKYCIAVLAAVVAYAASTIFSMNLEDDRSYVTQVCYLHVLTSSFLPLPYTAFMTHILITTSNVLQKNLTKDGLSSSNSGEIIQEYRNLWLKLVKLTRNILTMVFGVVLDYSLKYISASTFCLYIIMDNLIVKGFDNEPVRFISTMVAIFSILYFLGLRFQLAHDSVQKMFIKNFFKNRKRLRFYEENAIDEIKIFTRIFKTVKADISCNGYFNVNQSTLLTLLSLVTTYLLIILQFRANTRPIIKNSLNKSASY